MRQVHAGSCRLAPARTHFGPSGARRHRYHLAWAVGAQAPAQTHADDLPGSLRVAFAAPHRGTNSGRTVGAAPLRRQGATKSPGTGTARHRGAGAGGTASLSARVLGWP